MSSKHVLLLLDWRTTDEILFSSLRDEAVEQCSNLFMLHQMTQSSEALVVTLKLLCHKGVEVVLDRTSCGSFEDGAVWRTLQQLYTRNAELVTPRDLDRSDQRAFRLRPLLAAVKTSNPPFPGPTLVLVSSSLLTHQDLFSFLSMITHTQAGSQGNGRHPYATHCIAVDGEAACVTLANFGDQHLSPQRLYRSSSDPTDIRFAFQASLTDFLLPSSRVALTLHLEEGHTIGCTARRPYLCDLRRCCLPEDFPAVQSERPGLCFSSGGVCNSPFEVCRAALCQAVEQSNPLAGDRRLPVLSLESALSPDLVDEAYLYGDPWLLTPGPQEWAAWSALFTVFANDVLLLRCSDPLLQSTHHLSLQQSMFVAFFKDRMHLIIRQVIPTELRREVIGDRAGGGWPTIRGDDTAAVERLRRLRERMMEKSSAEKLEGGVAVVASHLTKDGCYALYPHKVY